MRFGFQGVGVEGISIIVKKGYDEILHCQFEFEIVGFGADGAPAPRHAAKNVSRRNHCWDCLHQSQSIEIPATLAHSVGVFGLWRPRLPFSSGALAIGLISVAFAELAELAQKTFECITTFGRWSFLLPIVITPAGAF